MSTNKSNKPELRFKGFSDDWEQRKFGNLYELNNERNINLMSFDKTFSIATMTYKHEGNGASERSLPTYKVLRLGDLAFEGHTNKKFRYGRFVVNDIGNGIMSPRFTTLRPKNPMPISFWKYYIHYEPIMRKKLVCSTKAGTMMNELVTKDFLDQSILVPNYEEQIAIGAFLIQLDNLITLHQYLCPKSTINELVHNSIFWEQRKLNDIVDFLDAQRRPLTENVRQKGLYPYYGASGIVDYIAGYLFDEELILLSEDGANITDRNYPVCFLAAGKYWVNNHAHVLKAKLGMDNNFICNALERKDYENYNTGMAMPKLNQETCKQIIVECPSYEEQKKIGYFLRKLDRLITLHQRKIKYILKANYIKFK